MIRSAICAAIVTWDSASALQPSSAKADAGGLELLAPGIFGSLAAVPGVPGWAYATIYIHLQSKRRSRRRISFFRGGGRGAVTVGLKEHADALVQGITYTSAMPVLGDHAAFTRAKRTRRCRRRGRRDADRAARQCGLGRRERQPDDVGRCVYQGTLKWNQGVHNEMVYVTGNIPSGTYDSGRLANLSLGFAAVDAGAGYTYLDPKAGNEFSVVGGPDLQSHEPGVAIPERHGLPCRLGRLTIP